MSYRWSEEEEHLLRLLIKNKELEDISSEFEKRTKQGIYGFRTTRSIDAIRKKCLRDSITKEEYQEYTSAKNKHVDTINRISKLQEKFNKKTMNKTIGFVHPNNIARKIISISDIHFPFARTDMIDYILQVHSDANICVINGDLFEGYSASRWPKSKRISALIEYNCAFELVKKCSEIFEQVILIEGNHDVRTADQLKSVGLQKESYDILRPNLMARLANGEQLDDTGMLVKKWDFSNVFFDTHEPWYVLVGKTIFAHPWSKGSSKPGYTVEKVNNYFKARYYEADYDSLVIGHVHKIYKGVINSKLLIEQGCLASAMDYGFSPRMQYGSQNGMNGFAIIYQDSKGNTDFNSSGPVFLGETLPPKKEIQF